jgi:hypothetical protein
VRGEVEGRGNLPERRRKQRDTLHHGLYECALSANRLRASGVLRPAASLELIGDEVKEWNNKSVSLFDGKRFMSMRWRTS